MTYETNVTRWSGRMAEGDGVVPSQVEIRCGCAFSYMNAVFRKNLTGGAGNQRE
jgi:hypothetical protein